MADTSVITATDIKGFPATVSYGQTVVHVLRASYIDLISSFKADGYNMCVDVTAVDYLSPKNARTLPAGVTAERFEVVVNLLSMTKHSIMDEVPDTALRTRVRIRTQVPANDPVVPTLFDLYPGSEALEREVFDLMGIRFTNHPDLTRILMPEEWEGHPLRKDYAQGRIPVQFKYTENAYDTSRQSETGSDS